MKQKIETALLSAMCLGVLFGLPILAGAITQEPQEVEAESEMDYIPLVEQEQEYIVRYATAINKDERGVTTYQDNDGNLWCAIDAPTEIGMDARLLFNSQCTKSIDDDVVIDITEIK